MLTPPKSSNQRLSKKAKKKSTPPSNITNFFIKQSKKGYLTAKLTSASTNKTNNMLNPKLNNKKESFAQETTTKIMLNMCTEIAKNVLWEINAAGNNKNHPPLL